MVALVAAAVAVGAGRSGQRAAALDLHTGAAWFPFATARSVVLLDGPTATKLAEVPLPSRPEAVAQAPDGGAYVAAGGRLLRVGGATLDVVPGVDLPLAAGDRVVPAGPAVWTVGQGGQFVQQREPSTLATLGRARFRGIVSSPAGAPDGRLWAAGGGIVASFAGGARRTEAPLDRLPHASVVVAGSRIAVADPSVGRAWELDPSTGRPTRPACLEVSTDASVTGATDRPWLLGVASEGAALTVSDLSTGRCLVRGFALDGPGAPGRYGAAVERRGKVYVPDHDTGQVLVVDPAATPPAVHRVPLGPHLVGRPFGLSSLHGHVWFDDPDGDQAGVITDEGIALLISKSSSPGTKATDAGGTPAVACAGPAQAPVGQPVTFRATSAIVPAPTSWSWSSSGNPAAGSGPAYSATWSTAGVKEVLVRAEAGDTSYPATCSVDIGFTGTTTSTSVPRSTTTTPETTIPVTDRTTSTTTPAALRPSFVFSPSPGIAGEPVTFEDTTTDEHSVVDWSFEGAKPSTSTANRPSATFSRPGTYIVTLTVERDENAVSTSRQVVVQAPGGLSISLDALPSATLRVGYSQALRATGGLPPYSWRLASGTLPEGLSLDEQTGVVSGTPTYATAADSAVTVSVTDFAGQKAERQVGVFVGLADVWRSVAPMSQARVGHTTTVLSNGEVLVADRPSCELFDPKTGQWSETGALNRFRSGGRAVLLGDGRVLLMGGFENGEVYSPNTGTWEMLPEDQRSFAPWGFSLTVLRNGLVLMAGGAVSSPGGTSVYNDAELLDPRTGLWTAVGPLTIGRAMHTAVLLDDGRVLISGGTTKFKGGWKSTATTEIFDPMSRTWSMGPPMTVARSAHGSLNTRIGVVSAGGHVDAGDALATTEFLPPASGAWIAGSPMMDARQMATGVVRTKGSFLVGLHDGSPLAVGGGASGLPMTVESFDLSSGLWSRRATFPSDIQEAEPVVLPDGRVFVAGGSANGTPTNAVEIYG